MAGEQNGHLEVDRRGCPARTPHGRARVGTGAGTGVEGGRGGKVWVKGEAGWRERGRMEREKPSGFGDNRMDWERGGVAWKKMG